jgi:DNA-binding MarR family transcriptional regulator
MSNHNPKDLSVELIHDFIKTYHYISREFEAQTSKLDKSFQISGPRLRVLLTVSKAGKIRMSELATKLEVTARSITDLVDALEKEKYIIRMPDPIDRRATLVQLTDLAEKQIAKIQSLEKEASEIVLKNLTESQKKQLLDILFILKKDSEVECLFDD